MTKTKLFASLTCVFLVCVYMLLSFTNNAYASVQVGAKAPDFTLPASDGKVHKLSDFSGKTVVLEWFNHECPYVRKHYDSGNMQALQKANTEKGVVWLTIISSASGKQGNVTSEQAMENTKKDKANPTAVLLDPAGEVGKLYDAKVTPHMFVISGEGVLVYNGAIDSVESANQDDIKGAENYVASALDAVLAGKKVTTPVTTPYGCGVKYKD